MIAKGDSEHWEADSYNRDHWHSSVGKLEDGDVADGQSEVENDDGNGKEKSHLARWDILITWLNKALPWLGLVYLNEGWFTLMVDVGGGEGDEGAVGVGGAVDEHGGEAGDEGAELMPS